jgi:hypothetical protein
LSPAARTAARMAGAATARPVRGEEALVRVYGSCGRVDRRGERKFRGNFCRGRTIWGEEANGRGGSRDAERRPNPARFVSKTLSLVIPFSKKIS